MPSKTVSLENEAFDLLKREKQPGESFSQTVRRLIRERPVLTAGELEEAMKAFEGRGAGPRRRRRAVA